jgi:hypothetical protein
MPPPSPPGEELLVPLLVELLFMTLFINDTVPPWLKMAPPLPPSIAELPVALLKSKASVPLL